MLNDPSLVEAMENAKQVARDVVEAEVHRRGVEGVDEPVFYQGEKVADVKKYSDSMLALRIKALAPEYRNKVEVSGTVQHKPVIDMTLWDPKTIEAHRIFVETYNRLELPKQTTTKPLLQVSSEDTADDHPESE